MATIISGGAKISGGWSLARPPSATLLFDAPLDTPGVANLSETLTINSLDGTLMFKYLGGDADGTNWDPTTAGEIIPILNGPHAYNQGSPLWGSASDDSVEMRDAAISGYQQSSGPFPAFDSSDFVFEAFLRWPTDLSQTRHIYSTYNGSNNNGYTRIFTGGTALSWISYNSAGGLMWNVFGGSATPGAWHHILIFADRTANVGWYVDGVAGTPSDISGAAGVSSTPTAFMLASHPLAGDTYSWIAPISYIAMWKRASGWIAGAPEQLAVAQARYAALCGLIPDTAAGTAQPSVISTRASTAYVDRFNGTDREAHLMGVNHPRMSWRKDSAATVVKGLLLEPAATNLALQSRTLGTTWTEVANSTGDDTAAGPEALTDLDSCVGTAVDTQHGWTQAITLTAVEHCISAFAAAGDQGWLYLADDTVANCWGYFDLTSGAGAVGNKGAGANDIKIERWSDALWRCWITVTGTVAAHTIAVYASDADDNAADPAFTGDASTDNIHAGYIQVEVGSKPSSIIVTTTGTVARATDVPVRYVGDDGNLNVTDDEGRIEFDMLDANYNRAAEVVMVNLNDGGAGTEIIEVSAAADDNVDGTTAKAGGNAGAVTVADDVSDDTKHTVKLAYKTDSLLIDVDGVDGAEDTSIDPPAALDRIEIGGDEAGVVCGLVVGNVKVYDGTVE